jgi:hypothetical protein
VKILEFSREGLSGVRGRGTFRWWRRELGRPSPAEACCGKARTASPYNRCGTGKWAAAGRESEAAVVPFGPAGQHNPQGGKGRCFVRARAGRPGSVSAGNTARSTLAAVGGDRVRALQHVLYRAARADPERRFHVLFDKVHRRDVLDRAWQEVRRNGGASRPGQPGGCRGVRGVPAAR